MLGFGEEEFLVWFFTPGSAFSGREPIISCPLDEPRRLPLWPPPPLPHDYIGVEIKTSVPDMTYITLETQGAQSIPQVAWG